MKLNLMKRCSPLPFLLFLLIIGLDFNLGGQLTAETFKTLYSFSAVSTNQTGVYTNSDGSNPYGLAVSGNTIYGVAFNGALGIGAIFCLNTDGTGFTNLHSFAGSPNDGANPANLILSGNTLYGAASTGGSVSAGGITSGTLFSLRTDGTGFTSVYSFSPKQLPPPSFQPSNTDGANPQAVSFSAGNVLYGTANSGGPYDSGTVFALNSDGSGFTTLHGFGYVNPSRPPYSNADGGRPNPVIVSGDTLYGTTYWGGTGGSGTVFAVKTNGNGFLVLHAFARVPAFPPFNNEGGFPTAGLVLSGNTLYGTTYSGGSTGGGTVFAVNVDGTGFRILHDGGFAYGQLTLSGDTLYGTTLSSLFGDTVFKLHTDGSGFETLHVFTGANDGGGPAAGMTLIGNTLYGTTTKGGTGGSGTIFSLSLPPEPSRLAIKTSDVDVVVSWPTNYTGQTLVCATNLDAPVWTTVVPPPVVLNGRYVLQAPVSATRQFYRLNP